MDAVNSLIATLYNEDIPYESIKSQVQDKFGVDISIDALRKRVERMKESGALDCSDKQLDVDNKADILKEIEQEAGGLFKIGVLDVETTGLWADFGYVLCCVIKDIDKNEYEIFRLDECKSYKNPDNRKMPGFWRRLDKELLEKIREAYEKFDIIVHFNGRNFDIKFLNTRMLKNGIHILPEMKQLDIYQIAKHRLRLRSKRLDALKEFLEIDDEESGHKWEYWQMAANGQKVGFDFVVNHCKKDVDRLAEVARRMKAQINFIRK